MDDVTPRARLRANTNAFLKAALLASTTIVLAACSGGDGGGSHKSTESPANTQPETGSTDQPVSDGIKGIPFDGRGLDIECQANPEKPWIGCFRQDACSQSNATSSRHFIDIREDGQIVPYLITYQNTFCESSNWKSVDISADRYQRYDVGGEVVASGGENAQTIDVSKSDVANTDKAYGLISISETDRLCFSDGDFAWTKGEAGKLAFQSQSASARPATLNSQEGFCFLRAKKTMPFISGAGYKDEQIEMLYFKSNWHSGIDGFGNGYTYSTNNAILLFKDGAAWGCVYNISPSDINIEFNKFDYPNCWGRWTQVDTSNTDITWGSNTQATRFDFSQWSKIVPVAAGSRFQQMYENINVYMGGYITRENLYFYENGEFTNSSSSMGAGYVPGGFVSTTPNVDFTRGTYEINGYTLRVTSESGAVSNLLFGKPNWGNENPPKYLYMLFDLYSVP